MNIINYLTKSMAFRIGKANNTTSFIIKWFNDLILIATSLQISLYKLQVLVMVFPELLIKLKRYITLDFEVAVIEEYLET